MAEPTAQEVLMLALINRARLDPAKEAARFGIDLNEGLAPGTITATAKQPLAFDQALFGAADAHSQSMIDFDYFAHVDPKTGSTPQTRANAAGYSGGVGENLSFRGTTTTIDPTAEIVQQHEDLFVDAGVPDRGHRTNTLDGRYQQVGIGQVIGVFTQSGTDFNASMVTEDFGIPSAVGQFLAGVAYDDTDGNDFYSVGEGRSGMTIALAGGNSTSGSAGAYSGAIGTGIQTIAFSGGGLASPVMISAAIAAGVNAEIDLVGQSTIETSTSVTEISGVSRIVGLGDIGLTLAGGSDGSVSMFGSDGNDTLSGGSVGDFLDGGAGADAIDGGAGFDLASWLGDTSGLTLNLGNQNANAGSAAGDTVTNVEAFYLTNSADSFTAGSTGIFLYGFDGNDTITGSAVSDVIDGGHGADTIDAGAGFDYVSYYSSSNPVTVDLKNPANNTGDAAVDTITNAEAYILTAKDDTFVGSDAGQNIVFGYEGNDTFIGGFNANNYFIGGDGNNRMVGGGVRDLFVGGSGVDTIVPVTPTPIAGSSVFNFTAGQDKLEISRAAFGLSPTYAVNDGTTLVSGTGPVATTTDPTFFYYTDSGLAYFDPDGAGATAATLLMQFAANPATGAAPALSAGDFKLV